MSAASTNRNHQGGKRGRRGVHADTQRSFEDVFGEAHLRETFNRTAALYLLQHADEFGLSDPVAAHSWDPTSDHTFHTFAKGCPKEAIEQLLKRTANGQSSAQTCAQGAQTFEQSGAQNGARDPTQSVLHVVYAKGKSDIDNSGRWYAQGSANLQRLPKKLRATLLLGLYLDLDFENCGPTILLNLCERHEIGADSRLGTFGYKWFRELVHNRASMLSEFGPGVTHDEAKQIVMQVVYGKTVAAICRDMPDKRQDLEAVDWLLELEGEVAQMYKELAACDDYAEIRARYKHTGNRDVKVVSSVLLALENKCLEQLCCFLHKKGILPLGEGVLCFDGIMVPDSPQNRARITDELLDEAAQDIAKHVRLATTLRIKNKPLGDGYELPDGYEQLVTEAYFCVESGDDQTAARIIINAAGDRIKRCGDRFFCRDKGSVIVREGEKAVRDTIMNMTDHELVIMHSIPGGNVLHYSKSTKLQGCIPRILASPLIRDDGFSTQLWKKSLRHIAFTNGVWSFADQRLMTFEESLEKEIYFTCDTGRPFCNNCSNGNMRPLQTPGGAVGSAQQTATATLEALLAAVAAADPVSAELHRRVIEPFLPDASQRAFFLNCVARAMAGDIRDKRWFMCLGLRNCGKGIFCKLLMYAFGLLSKTMLAENLLNRGAPQDAAKAQSWMVDHEFTRIAFSNELSKAGRNVVDGESVKRLCSNGDVIECRKNHQDEKQIRLQMTMFLFANDMPPVEPVDAFQTMIGFKFRSEFHEAADFADAAQSTEHDGHTKQSAAGPIQANAQKNWRVMDHSIDTFIEQPQVIDAFTQLVLAAYTPDIQAPPPVVQEDTKSIKGAAAESQEQRFARIMECTRDQRDVLFYQEIRRTGEDAGMGRLSDSKIDSFVDKLYGLKPGRPSKMVDGKLKQDRGFKGLSICYNGYDEKTERLRRIEGVKQGVRSGVTTHDRFTADRAPFRDIS